VVTHVSGIVWLVLRRVARRAAPSRALHVGRRVLLPLLHSGLPDSARPRPRGTWLVAP
jgi:hypothetical protein